MCEIATIPADTVSSDDDDRHDHISRVVDLAQVFYDENPHGLGVVATMRDQSDESFTHQAFKTGWTERGMSATALYEFVDEYIDEAWRFTVHARFATAGDVDKQGTHPIIIRDCDETPWQAVVHNGSVRGHSVKRKRLRKNGHTFSTEVDSEVIAHETDLPDPDTFGSDDDEWDVPNLRGNLNYILFHDDMILVYTEGKYHVTDDYTMACSHREFNTDEPTPGEEGWFLFTPDGEVSFREMETPTYTRATTTSANLSRSTNPWKGYRSTFGTNDAGVQSRIDRSYNSATDDESASATDDADTRSAEADSGNVKPADGVDSPQNYESDSAASKTRETLLMCGYESNPSMGRDAALPQSEHAGFFVAADEMLCLEHNTRFTYVCPDCSDYTDSELNRVGVKFQPDIFKGATSHVADVNTSGGTRRVTRCPTTHEWYVGDGCPTCGVAHDAQIAYRF